MCVCVYTYVSMYMCIYVYYRHVNECKRKNYLQYKL